jgi:hypothetical protein
MALHSIRINYTVYSPHHIPGTPCREYLTATKARLAAIKLGVGSRLRRNFDVFNKSRKEINWYVDRVWEWDGTTFVDITNNAAKGLP